MADAIAHQEIYEHCDGWGVVGGGLSKCLHCDGTGDRLLTSSRRQDSHARYERCFQRNIQRTAG